MTLELPSIFQMASHISLVLRARSQSFPPKTFSGPPLCVCGSSMRQKQKRQQPHF